GSVEIHAQTTFAYDTFGLREWAHDGHKTDSTSLKKILDGFYLLDKEPGATIDDPEIFARGTISAGAGVDAFVVSGGVDASLIGTLELNLADPDGDGKVRLRTELTKLFDLGPLCIFDITG